jgi:type I restriction enzyme, R subunit
MQTRSTCSATLPSSLLSEHEKTARLKDHPETFLGKYGKEAREILTVLLDKYTDHGTDQFSIPDILEVPPISEYGNVMEIANYFGGPEQLRTAVNEMQQVLYAA